MAAVATQRMGIKSLKKKQGKATGMPKAEERGYLLALHLAFYRKHMELF